MKVLVACEYSGRVRDAFAARGHDAWSCDFLPTEQPGKHLPGDVCKWLDAGWDLMVAHPPCTYLANSGAKHLYLGMKKENGPNPERWRLMREGIAFFNALWSAPIPRIAMENPIMHGHASTLVGERPTQIVQPWMFGHPERKATCLWLRNLPPLAMTNDARPEMAGKPKRETDRVHYASPGPDRWKHRSRTYQGLADAMGEQWGNPAQMSLVA